MEEANGENIVKQKLLRCVDWLQKQNSQEPQKLSLQNKNDIQFIIETNADRKNFLLSVAEDEATVPVGVDEQTVEPKAVPLRWLRVDNLRMECEWHSCKWYFNNYDLFQKHVSKHVSDLHVIDSNSSAEYVCLWDVCGHKASDFNEMVRHINYHAYHSRLLAIGFNGRATLKLVRCKRDSSKRNQLPPLKSEHCCMWTGCEEKFNAIQLLFDHVRQHINYSSRHLCSWAGCGAVFPRRALLTMHVRSHTRERVIACYHCGQHFSCNRKLCDHLRRQNPNSSNSCSVCGEWFATQYLLREHARQHVSAHACALCDMSAPTLAALAQHVRYRHVAPTAPAARAHACPHCAYRAITKSDLRKHIPTHTRKRKAQDDNSEKDISDEENSEVEVKKPKVAKKYACHMCPEKEMKVFTRGSRLTTHLVKVHGAQWPFGHSRFRYQISEDGMYRLTTTRYEILEVSKKIVDGYSGPKESITNDFEFNLEQTAEPTDTTPRRFEITLKNSKEDSRSNQEQSEKEVEITMCDVDEHGNIISSKVIRSDVVYT